jgi:abortive infection bacteriophage resistance protein
LTFEKIWNLYTFDRKLRLLIIDAIERIEVAFRVSISEVMSIQYNPFWYVHSDHFKHLRWHIEFMDKVLALTQKQDHVLIKHFYNTYSCPDFPPSWIIVECLTFGTWSKVFDNLKKRSDKIAIANRLGIGMMHLLSWIKCLTELRNLCAHHERIWNHIFRYTPKDAPNMAHQSHRFYQQAYILNEILNVISPGSDWKDRLKTLMKEIDSFSIKKMGFSSDWEADPFWRSEKNDNKVSKKHIKRAIFV